MIPAHSVPSFPFHFTHLTRMACRSFISSLDFPSRFPLYTSLTGQGFQGPCPLLFSLLFLLLLFHPSLQTTFQSSFRFSLHCEGVSTEKNTIKKAAKCIRQTVIKESSKMESGSGESQRKKQREEGGK
mmetsp:Transcript_23103/g.45454  ORF Transcript_23103/g.45454 Transcript_23103/m.45454 type:complete len:128 (-) Transcript_23103:367-750(-)